MIFDFENFRIAPYAGNTCWKIMEKGEEDAKGEWKEPRYFPSSFKQAILKMRELVKRSNDNDAVMTLNEAVKRAEELDKQLIEALNKLPFDSAKDVK